MASITASVVKMFKDHAKQIASIGMKAREKAFAAGLPIYYMKKEFGSDIVREYPDGRRERLHTGPGRPERIRKSSFKENVCPRQAASCCSIRNSLNWQVWPPAVSFW